MAVDICVMCGNRTDVPGGLAEVTVPCPKCIRNPYTQEPTGVSSPMCNGGCAGTGVLFAGNIGGGGVETICLTCGGTGLQSNSYLQIVCWCCGGTKWVTDLQNCTNPRHLDRFEGMR